MASKRKIEVEVVGDTENFRRSVKRASDDGDSWSKSLDKLNVSLGNTTHQTQAFGATVNLVKPAALITSLGFLASAASAAGAGVIALGSALAPAAGAIAAYPAAFAAAAQAMGVVKLATHGLSQALAGNKKALADLPPAGRDFVKTLNDLKPRLQELRQTAAAGLFPGVSDALHSALGNFDRLKPAIAGTSGVLSDLARSAGRFIGSGGFGRDFTTVTKNNEVVIRNVGNAGIALGKALVDVIVVAQPLVRWMSEMALAGAKNVEQFIHAGRESGRLADFLERTRVVMSQLGSIAFSLGTALFNIAKAGGALGGDLLKAIQDNAKAFADWTGSASGQNAIAAFFERAREPIFEVARLVRDVTKAFFSLSQSSNLAPLIAQVRTQLLPILTNVVASTTAAFGPHLVNAVTQLARVFGLMAGSSGPLVILVDLIATFAGALASVMERVPGLNAALVTMAGTAAVIKALNLASWAAGAATGFTTLRTAVGALSVAQLQSRVETAALGALYVKDAVVKGASTVATGLLTGATWALNVALRANPFILVATLLVALGAAIVVAYRHSETFRNVVKGALGAVETAFTGLRTTVLSVLRTIENTLETVWSAIRTATLTSWNAVEDHILTPIRQARDTIRGVVASLGNNVQAGWNVIRSEASAAWNAVEDHVMSPIRHARDTIGGVIAGLRSNIAGGWSNIKADVSAFAGDMRAAIVGAFKGAANDVVTFINDIIDVINIIPGVPNIGHVKGFAQGGVIEAARTGGLVTAPTVIMGEEAPRHPEYVIPTNPAYRGRAQMLVGQAAQAVGLATGGTFRGKVSTFGPPMEPAGTTASGVSSAEPGIALFNRGTLGKVFEVSIGGHSAQLKQTDIGPAPWTGRVIDVTGAGARVLGFDPHNFPTDSIGTASPGGDRGGNGIIGKIFGAIGGVLGDLLEKGAGFLLDKLPGTDVLPDWLKGTGSYVLDKAKDWIVAKVKDVIGSFGGDRVAKMISFAEGISAMHEGYSWGGGHNSSFSHPYDCSGFVSAILHAGGMLDSPITTDGLKVYGEAGDGKLITIGVRGSTGRNAHTMIKIGNRYYESGGGHGAARVGGWDGDFPIHRHPPGMASGGIIGRVGELGPEDVYANGIGQVRVRPASQSGRGGGDVMLTKHGNVNINSRRDVDLALRKLSLRVA